MNGRGIQLRVFIFLAATTSLLFKTVVCNLLGDGPIAGPTDLIIKEIKGCPKRIRGEDGFRIHSTRLFLKKDRPYEFHWTANISLLFPIDDVIFGEFRVASWSPRGAWKTGIKNLRFGHICSSLLRFAGETAEPVLTAFYGAKPSCPLPSKNDIVVNNVTVSTRSVHTMDGFVYGRWRADVLFLTSSKTKGCIRVLLDTKPRKSP